ncbi:MAG: PEGA domain-containing protein [Clostridia bacterium]
MDKDKWTPDDEFWAQTGKTPPQPVDSGNAEEDAQDLWDDSVAAAPRDEHTQHYRPSQEEQEWEAQAGDTWESHGEQEQGSQDSGWEPSPMDEMRHEEQQTVHRRIEPKHHRDDRVDEPEPEGDGGDGGDDDIKKLVRLLVIIGVSTIAVLIIAGIIIFKVMTAPGKSANENSQSSAVESEESSITYEGSEMAGVVLNVNEELYQVTVYDGVNQVETTFSLQNAKSITDQYGKEMNIGSIQRGQIVEVRYNAANENAVELFRISAKTSALEDVTGATVSDHTITVGDTTYTFDDKLVCTYQGKEFDIASLTSQQVFTAQAMEDHIYTIYVTYSTGTLKLVNQDLDQYAGAELKATPAAGAPVTAAITKDMQPIALLEGLNSIVVTKDSVTVYSGQIFITSGKEQELTLPNGAEKTGTVKFSLNPANATVVINGQTYHNGDEATLPYGEYTMTVKADAYESLEQTITVGQPYVTAALSLNASKTKVSIESSMANSIVYINGDLYDSAPCEVMLGPGTHEITVSNTGYKDVTMTIQITAGKAEQVLYFSNFEKNDPEPEPPESSTESSEDSQTSSNENNSSRGQDTSSDTSTSQDSRDGH